MLILASLLNYGILKFLTIKVAPIHVIKGKRGLTGNDGDIGPNGPAGPKGIKASRKSLGNNDVLIGDFGTEGEKGTNASCDVSDKYCIINNTLSPSASDTEKEKNKYMDGSHMNLTGYRARTLPNICLFGYRYNKENDVCESWNVGSKSVESCPMNQNGDCINHICDTFDEYNVNTNLVDKSRSFYFSKNWAKTDKENDRVNCSYKKNIIEKMTPAQFKSWMKLLSERGCKGVPKISNGLVPNKFSKYSHYNRKVGSATERSKNNLIWEKPKECIPQDEDNIKVSYYKEVSASGNDYMHPGEGFPRCNKVVYFKENNEWKFGYKNDQNPLENDTYCDCDVSNIKKKEIGEKCLYDLECKDSGLFGINECAKEDNNNPWGKCKAKS